MRAGDLNKKVRFSALVRTPLAGGGASENWTPFVTVWGQFSSERGRERIQAGRLNTEMAGVLRVRSSASTRQVTETHRVTVDGTVYDIRSIANPDQRNDMLEMTVEAVLAIDAS